jgi:hypothetical protein
LRWSALDVAVPARLFVAETCFAAVSAIAIAIGKACVAAQVGTDAGGAVRFGMLGRTYSAALATVKIARVQLRLAAVLRVAVTIIEVSVAAADHALTRVRAGWGGVIHEARQAANPGAPEFYGILRDAFPVAALLRVEATFVQTVGVDGERTGHDRHREQRHGCAYHAQNPLRTCL